MTMLEIHAAALDSSNPVYHEFLLRYRANERVVYGFVEGKEDPMFYRGLIELNLPNGWEVELIRSGNRDKVLKVLADVDWTRFSPKRVCFFVDRDLSEFVPGESHCADNLYVTDNYSIENEAATFGTLKRVLEEVLEVTGLTTSESDQLRNLFEANLSFFQQEMAPLMAQILLWRRNGVKANLNDISPKDFFGFTDGVIGFKVGFEAASSRVQHAANAVKVPPSAEADLVQAEAEFRGRQGPEKYVRGKYILWFFVECASELHRTIPKFCSKHAIPPKVHVSFGPGNAMVLIGPRLRCPASLRGFLELNYGQYISEV